MPTNHEHEEYPEPEQHREYLYDLLDQRAKLLATKHRPDEGSLACYRIEVEREQ